MRRRDFIRACAATCVLGAHETFAAEDLKPRFYSRARLVDSSGKPVKAAKLAAGKNYIFHYPFEGTPCFLLNLGKPTRSNVSLKTESGAVYQWTGGVGPARSIVGYSAICAHKLTYPTRQISFISYRRKSTVSQLMKPETIHCCSEHSEYDPASGGRVVGGPAPQPLSAVMLEHDAASDELHAIGTLGGEMFDEFFAKYEFRLALDYGADRARQRVADRTTVVELGQFCRQQVRC